MKNIAGVVSFLSMVVVVGVGSMGVVTVETGCSKECSTSEEQSCTNAYTQCINEAAASADLNKCNSCVETYCNCYDSCGNSCDKDKLSGSCAGAGK